MNTHQTQYQLPKDPVQAVACMDLIGRIAAAAKLRKEISDERNLRALSGYANTGSYRFTEMLVADGIEQRARAELIRRGAFVN